MFFINFYQQTIRSYQIFACRFYPSCSEYAKEALLRYGLIKGMLKALTRLLHCHPFSHKSGADPLR
ncbi:MAG: membrane protein insertion efficiency factor YidD [Candidatus Omnitrophica bacterium]|nr:membrane protein insertion efficiency factor YidD [Candidatus Omnitrophota bacterium]MCM8770458.1 membrane protein insertion efficiency factor YidD [Candidatus Omnitrophota bacterium]